jgi:hypothetical protein
MKTASPLQGNGASQREELDDLFQSLVETELANSISWMIGLRWIAGAGVLFGALLVGPLMKLGMPTGAYTLIGLGVLVYNLAFYLINRRFHCNGDAQPACRWLAVVQIGLDWLAMVPLIHFTGGIESPVSSTL